MQAREIVQLMATALDLKLNLIGEDLYKFRYAKLLKVTDIMVNFLGQGLNKKHYQILNECLCNNMDEIKEKLTLAKKLQLLDKLK